VIEADKLRAIATLLLMLATASCDSIKTQSDYAPGTDFSNYRTFTWISDNPMIGSSPMISPLTPGRIQLAIIDALKDKGISFVTEQKSADFVVAFMVGTRQQVRVDTTNYPVGYRGPYAWGVGFVQDVDVREFTQGRLAIDIFDTKSRQPVWHGYGSKNVTEADQKNAAEVIHKAVAAILADFPPKPKS
jgi:hypothetical protein